MSVKITDMRFQDLHVHTESLYNKLNIQIRETKEKNKENLDKFDERIQILALHLWHFLKVYKDLQKEQNNIKINVKSIRLSTPYTTRTHMSITTTGLSYIWLKSMWPL